MRRRSVSMLAAGLAVTVGLVLAGCAGTATPVPSAPATTPSARTPATASVHPVGEPTVIASGLAAPWSMVRLPSGSTFISERDTGMVKELTPDGALRDVATVPGVVHRGESGLLGLEFVEDNGQWLYAYLTTATDNRIVRFEVRGGAGNHTLGTEQAILTGIAKANYHDGGRIKLGPDGMLYATVGDAADSASAQNLASLNGKILRMRPDGTVPDDNPFPGSLVYSYGHRNPQGLAWDRGGQLWAAEFGQNTWDEVNLIRAGGNYGWPVVEGASADPRYIDPVFQWPTAVASPSGLAYTGGTLFLAGLGGKRLWALYPTDAAASVPYYVGTFGRLRDVIPGPNGTLWLLTNNTDGRGSPGPSDDRILQVALSVS